MEIAVKNIDWCLFYYTPHMRTREARRKKREEKYEKYINWTRHVATDVEGDTKKKIKRSAGFVFVQ